jgi:hypothetical protein
MAGQSRTLKLSILADVDQLKKSLTTGSKDVDGFAGKIGDFSKKAALAFAAVAAAAGAMAIKIGVDAVKAASDLSETISKVGVLFGDTADDIEKFADGAASSLGQTKQEALDAAATFATFGKSAGLSGKDLSKFSIDFVKLSSDLASFNNTSPEQAINAIGSALRGEAEPLRQYGVLLDDASLRQAALELGIISTTKNALTPQQKVLAAQALIYKQTGQRHKAILNAPAMALPIKHEFSQLNWKTPKPPLVRHFCRSFWNWLICFREGHPDCAKGC